MKKECKVYRGISVTSGRRLYRSIIKQILEKNRAGLQLEDPALTIFMQQHR